MSCIWYNVVSSSWFCCHGVTHLCNQLSMFGSLPHFRTLHDNTRRTHVSLTQGGEGVRSLGWGETSAALTPSKANSPSPSLQALPMPPPTLCPAPHAWPQTEPQTASVQMTSGTDTEAVRNQHQVAQPIRGEQGPFNASEP